MDQERLQRRAQGRKLANQILKPLSITDSVILMYALKRSFTNYGRTYCQRKSPKKQSIGIDSLPNSANYRLGFGAAQGIEAGRHPTPVLSNGWPIRRPRRLEMVTGYL